MQSLLMQIDENGQGDLVVNKNGAALGNHLEAALICALYGGNIEEDTQANYARGEKNRGFWGNAFLPLPFNSQTERALLNAVLPQDKESIRAAVFEDVEKLVASASINELIDVNAERNNQNRIEITIYARVLNNITKKKVG